MQFLQIETSHTPINARLNNLNSRELAVLLPGFRYSSDSPLFYYLRQLFSERGIDTLSVDYAYDRDAALLTDTDENRLARFKSDGQAILEFVEKLEGYDRVTIVGKSLGTISMGWASLENLPNARLIWLTPSISGTVLTEQILKCTNPSVCLIGTRDPGYSDTFVDDFTAPNRTVVIIEGADHGISHEDGATASVPLVHQAIIELTSWIDATD